MRRGMLFVAAVALVVVAGSSSAAAQAPAGCSRAISGDSYYTKDTRCGVDAAGAQAGCHRTYAVERGEATAYDEIDCSAGAGADAVGCTRTDTPGYERTVTDDCVLDAGPVHRNVQRSEGPFAPELPDDPLSF